jgi:AcrR family transcriptional regulator
MKTRARPYRMENRAAAAAATRARILGATIDQLLARWYDEVTIASIAEAAGVSGQTVLNHFGGKEELAAAAAEELGHRIAGQRAVAPGDVAGAVRALVGDYEVTGDASVRMLALEGRVAAVAPHLAKGRAFHRDWVRRTFRPPPKLLPLLVVATDVYAWKLLRRDQGLSRAATVDALTRLVQSLIDKEDSR